MTFVYTATLLDVTHSLELRENTRGSSFAKLLRYQYLQIRSIIALHLTLTHLRLRLARYISENPLGFFKRTIEGLLPAIPQIFNVEDYGIRKR